MKVSIIIPALQEGENINKLLASLKASAGMPHEVIVVDGDSSGSTIAHISDTSVRTMTAARGRAHQMNAGAAHASGDVLLFLHADTILPPQALANIAHALSDAGVVGGAFDLKIQNSRWIFRVLERFASWKHRWTRIPYGDQAIFIRRSFFEKIGAYSPIPLMEDVELMQRVKRHNGRIIILPEAAITSARKWETDGIIYTVVRNWIIQTLFLLGVPARHLVKHYYK